MAAYAAVVSLTNTVDQILNHARLSKFLDMEQLESLRDQVGSLFQDFVQRTSYKGSKDAQGLEQRLARAAYEAEDLIESHVADRLLGCSLLLDLQKVEEEMDSIKEEVKKIRGNLAAKDQPLLAYEKPSSTKTPSNLNKTTMVGFQEEKYKIKESLSRESPSQVIISVVGMGGAGKTTLATSVYEDRFIVEHYEVKIWITVSQEYKLRDLLLQIPVCQKEQQRSEISLSCSELGEVLHKRLFHTKYLIIMDDVWNAKVWNDLQHYFPKDGKTVSRILVTTRLTGVAKDLGSNIFDVKPLEDDKSWKLFLDKVFDGEPCPTELENIGKNIVEKCKGLPLSIVVIGGLLATCRTQEYWMSVAKEMATSTTNTEVEKLCLDVVSLSYCHLPVHLKPCFLYMGIFPKGKEINASQLIKHWVAEGFLKSDNARSLEELSEDYLKDLVDRNLILVWAWKWNGSVKTCGVHDLLHDLCLWEADKEFFCVRKRYVEPQITDEKYSKPQMTDQKCSNYWKLRDVLDSSTNANVLKVPEKHVLSYEDKLLRVLNNVRGRPQDIFGGVNLRYVSDRCFNLNWLTELPSSISLLWNLHTLICDNINGLVRAPIEIWDMQQLRHVVFPYIHLPNPPSSKEDGGSNVAFKNLQTLKKIVNFEWSKEAIERILSIKELKIAYIEKSMDAKDYHLNNLRLFQSLESLQADFRGCRETRRNLSLGLEFPDSLRKLTLEHSGLCWDELRVIGTLPHLEIFKHKGTITGDTWNPDEKGFRSLKSLDVENCKDLIYWNAERQHFPILENLGFGYVPNLDKIPLDIGDIPTLKTISLQWCQESAAISVHNLMEEQMSYERDELEVRIAFRSCDDARRFREQVNLEELKSMNFHIDEAFG